MNAVLWSAGSILLFAGLAFGFLFRKLVSKEQVNTFTLEGLDDISISKYRPMERLLVDDDFEFLGSQEGNTPGLARKLRAQRRRVFRGYLRCMRRDFARLYLAAQLLLLHSTVDRPDLAISLLKQRALFTLALLAVEWRLVLHAARLAPVNVHHLVEALDGMRAQIQQLAPAPQSMSA